MRINLVAQGTLDGSIADGDAIDLPLMLFAVQRIEMALQSGSLPLRGESEARAVQEAQQHGPCYRLSVRGTRRSSCHLDRFQNGAQDVADRVEVGEGGKEPEVCCCS
jgi:hypothetical protein